MRRSMLVVVVLVALLSLCSVAAFAQKGEVQRYDVYTGYSYLTTPNMNLNQNGFASEFGYNWNRWLALGGDYSYFGGSSSMLPSMLKSSVQAGLAPYMPYLPKDFNVPYNAVTYNWSIGGQLNIRKLKAVTFFIRPDIGSMHQTVWLHPGPGLPIAPNLPTQIVAKLTNGKMAVSDTVPFFGFGGGMDFNVSKPMAIRVMADYVHTGLFDGMLNSGQNSIRFSVSPTFRFGPTLPK